MVWYSAKNPVFTFKASQQPLEIGILIACGSEAQRLCHL